MIPLPKEISQRIAEIRDDTTHGAAELTSRAGELFHAWAVGMREISYADASAQLSAIATSLCAAQPLMAPLVRLGSELLFAAERCETSPEIAQTTMTRSKEFVERLHTHLDAVAKVAAEIIPDMAMVLTHSSSTTVFEALLRAAEQGKRLRVFCTESRPMREGFTLARRLSAAGIPTTLLIDSAACTLLPSVHLVLVGGDAVTPEGLLNKIGTYGLAVAARLHKKTFYALCDSTKFLPPTYRLPPERARNPHEVAATPLPGIEVLNYYFDLTPLPLLTAVISENGIQSIPKLELSLPTIRVHPALIPPESTG